MKFLIPLFFCLFSIQAMAQKERYFTEKQAIEWMPQLIGVNLEIIGEDNEKGIKKTDELEIEYLFITDKEEKAQALGKRIQATYGYEMYKPYCIENVWVVSGITNPLIMEFDKFSKWTVDFCKLGFEEDAKLIHWNQIDSDKIKKIDEFWNWFKKNQDDYFNLDPSNMDELNRLFDILQQQLSVIHEKLVFEFSAALNNGKREFILSADGIRNAFPDLLYLYKRSPNFDNFIIIPFKQGFVGDPQIEFNNGFTLSWDKIMFKSEKTPEGLSIDFYIKDYDESDGNFGVGLAILLDSYLGEYDAVMQIRHVTLHKLNPKDKKKLLEFKELKQIVENHKRIKNKTE